MNRRGGGVTICVNINNYKASFCYLSKPLLAFPQNTIAFHLFLFISLILHISSYSYISIFLFRLLLISVHPPPFISNHTFPRKVRLVGQLYLWLGCNSTPGRFTCHLPLTLLLSSPLSLPHLIISKLFLSPVTNICF